ncbi:hypothetical protein ACWDEX_37150, partial [Streptomyces sp. NPDC001020]
MVADTPQVLPLAEKLAAVIDLPPETPSNSQDLWIGEVIAWYSGTIGSRLCAIRRWARARRRLPLGDKAYDSKAVRRELRRRRILPVISLKGAPN